MISCYPILYYGTTVALIFSITDCSWHLSFPSCELGWVRSSQCVHVCGQGSCTTRSVVSSAASIAGWLRRSSTLSSTSGGLVSAANNVQLHQLILGPGSRYIYWPTHAVHTLSCNRLLDDLPLLPGYWLYVKNYIYNCVLIINGRGVSALLRLCIYYMVNCPGINGPILDVPGVLNLWWLQQFPTVMSTTWHFPQCYYFTVPPACSGQIGGQPQCG